MCGMGFNFFESYRKTEPKVNRARLVLVGLAVFVIGGMLALVGLSFFDNRNIEADIALMEKEMSSEQIVQAYSKAQELMKKNISTKLELIFLEVLNGMVDYIDVATPETLDTVAGCVPNKLLVTHIGINNQGSIAIEGLAETQAVIGQFESNLRDAAIYTEKAVMVAEYRVVESEKLALYHFSILVNRQDNWGG